MSKLSEVINSIIHGDVIFELKKLPENSVDVIFADPPYNMQTEGELMRSDGTKFAGVQDQWDKFEGFTHYDEFSKSWLAECKRVLKEDGSIWVIGSFQNIYRLGNIMQDMGFWILNDIIWSKPNAVPNFGGTRFQNSHETLLWCTKSKKSKYTFNYKTMKQMNNGKQDKSIWNISICIGAERIKGADGKKAHSTQKPELLLEKVILSSSKPEDLVLDPFFGTGTTGAVAKRLGRNFIGIEREKAYVELAKKRIDEVSVEITNLSNLELEVKPPKISTKELIECGMLREGQTLFSKDGSKRAVLDSSGKASDGIEVLSIHKMSAKFLNKPNNNGWTYFWVEYDGDFVLLSDLRYIRASEITEKPLSKLDER